MSAWYRKHLEQFKSVDLDDPIELDELKLRLAKFSPIDPEVSIVIPAWNEEKNILPTLSSLASTNTPLRVEIIVINNNSTDRTQQLLDQLGVRNYFQPQQGISYARQLGLQMARGSYHLCADSDTLYPPTWIDSMVKPMRDDSEIVGVYGRYSFIPTTGKSRWSYKLYEFFTGIVIRLRRKNQEYINVLGFNMGFVREVACSTAGFEVLKARKFDNAANSADHVHESEDGRMAVRLKEQGRLALVTNNKARVFTSSRRLEAEGGLFRSFAVRFKNYAGRIF